MASQLDQQKTRRSRSRQTTGRFEAGTFPNSGESGYRFELVALVALVLATFFARLTTLPVCGEEPRWARGAVQMIETGDWIVPRQQGQVFPERPPVTSWAMAVVGLARGKVDAVAVRLPSVLAILLTALVIFAYGRTFLSPLGAFASAAVFATFGQVLQLGRMGESEAVFTLFVSASLLIWHLGYSRGWPQLCVWAAGYSLAALGALTKGLQAPVYFIAVTGLYLVVRRDWRWIFSWRHAVGIAALVAIVGAWQVPYFLATDWESVVATWTGLARDRLGLGGLLAHVASYPLETVACLLPWSPLLVVYAWRRFRESWGAAVPMVRFLTIALAVTYPTVLFASGARGRYFMPMYPCVALLIGLVIERSSQAADLRLRVHWNRFVQTSALLIAAGGITIAAASLAPQDWRPWFAQTPSFAVLFLMAALLTSAVAVWSWRDKQQARTRFAVLAIAGFLGLGYTGTVVNVQASRWNDLRPAVAKMQNRLPQPSALVSFGPIHHRFAYFYEMRIPERPWPFTIADVPAEIEYFCFNRRPADTPQRRNNSRGRSISVTPGTLPFDWEPVGKVGCARVVNNGPQREVVVGRIVRDSSGQIAARRIDPGPKAASTIK